jgi:hypothetical protein
VSPSRRHYPRVSRQIDTVYYQGAVGSDSLGRRGQADLDIRHPNRVALHQSVVQVVQRCGHGHPNTAQVDLAALQPVLLQADDVPVGSGLRTRIIVFVG